MKLVVITALLALSLAALPPPDLGYIVDFNSVQTTLTWTGCSFDDGGYRYMTYNSDGYTLYYNCNSAQCNNCSLSDTEDFAFGQYAVESYQIPAGVIITPVYTDPKVKSILQTASAKLNRHITIWTSNLASAKINLIPGNMSAILQTIRSCIKRTRQYIPLSFDHQPNCTLEYTVKPYPLGECMQFDGLLTSVSCYPVNATANADGTITSN